MVSLPQRMRKLQTKLLAIRLGSGAAILPKDVKRIHLRFAPRMEGGHMGPRKFWRHELVRLKYHNPAVAMTIDRTALREDPALMSIHFASAEALQTSAPDQIATDSVQTIDMKHKSNSEILEELMKLTKARAVEPTVEENEEIRELEEQRVRSARDSVKSAEVRARVKREQELLEQARGDVAGQTA
ncbi:hypothetical protein LTR62_006199 [Meristemomyces frigidus]|uniref:Ribosomal protein/NADH dehydrogenase domain-containing protein n=1 Tax=Meristemomyces frigidus TaxID=1508187 RepID=A0AAN7TEP1_9PEZI|nr:hypothetical protein LTR62_006199 [Meristemomyces frigidus]